MSLGTCDVGVASTPASMNIIHDILECLLICIFDLCLDR